MGGDGFNLHLTQKFRARPLSQGDVVAGGPQVHEEIFGNNTQTQQVMANTSINPDWAGQLWVLIFFRNLWATVLFEGNSHLVAT